MPDETLRDFLERRERELRHQIAALNSQLTPKVLELNEVLRMQGVLGMDLHASTEAALKTIAAAMAESGQIEAPSPKTSNAILGTLTIRDGTPAIPSRYESMTIKQLAIQALWDGFRKSGATAAQIREFIRSAYGREVDRPSLSPQLSRLKAEGLVDQNPDTETWTLVPGPGDELKVYGIIPPWAKLKPQEPGAATEQASGEDTKLLELAHQLRWSDEDEARSSTTPERAPKVTDEGQPPIKRRL